MRAFFLLRKFGDPELKKKEVGDRIFFRCGVVELSGQLQKGKICLSSEP